MSGLVEYFTNAYDAATDPSRSPAYTTEPIRPSLKSLNIKSYLISLDAAGTIP